MKIAESDMKIIAQLESEEFIKAYKRAEQVICYWNDSIWEYKIEKSDDKDSDQRVLEIG